MPLDPSQTPKPDFSEPESRSQDQSARHDTAQPGHRDVLTLVGSAMSIFAALPDAVIVADTDRKIRWVNTAAETMFRCTADQLTGLSPRDLYVDPAQSDINTKRHYNPDRPAGTHSYSAAFRRFSGESFNAEVTGGILRDSQGKVLGFMAQIKDLSTARDFEAVVRVLYQLSSDPGISATDKIRQFLTLGSVHYNLPNAWISWIEEGSYTVVHAVPQEIFTGTRLEFSNTFCLDTLQAGEPLLIHDSENQGYSAHPGFAIHGTRSYIGVPLIVDGSVFGTLRFSGPEARPPFGPVDLDLIKLIAAWVSQEFSRSKAMEALNRRADTDFLTGCLGREAWQREAQLLLDEAARQNQPLSLIFLDLDHFKSVNDHQGHQTGDQVLKSVAELCCKHFGALGPVGRLGGEEFVVLLPGLSAEQTLPLADALRRAVAGTRLAHEDGPVSITASLGIASNHAGITLPELLDHADRAMYRAKARGRNQSVVFGSDAR
ncbi:diguanylate cyclase [Candidatus Halocynthiibacter alkanivorans]|uniref:sensor domain-containing diguanylate cyclase n=1 Tax=Candidatus Halocynthiibacter alkanivorans TaxID=2267619 RepID=UPI00109C80EB|nr:diguanylate cyclase [Candidatus Halocynthiibacter alkanivorans]